MTTEELEASWRSGEHEYRKVADRWQLHYLPSDDGIPLRYCDKLESEKLEAIAKKDAALRVCTIALEKSKAVLDDWMLIYAPVLCDQVHVDEAAARIDRAGGTVAYIAEAVDTNRIAIAKAEKTMK